MNYRTKIRKQQLLAEIRKVKKQKQHEQPSLTPKKAILHKLNMYIQVIKMFEPFSDEWVLCKNEIQELEIELYSLQGGEHI